MNKTRSEQLDLFGSSLPPIRIDKPIRLIELFGGIGSQAKALERLGADFERWRLVEWAIPSIKAYAAIHEGWRGDDGSADGMGKDELVAFTAGVSQNYNEPISDERRARMGTKALREIASAMKACKDLVPDVSRVHPKDLGIEKEGEREHAYIMSYSFPCQDLSGAGNRAGMAFPLRVKIKDATLKGYLEAMEGDGIVVRTRKGGRGTVAKGSSPTICATGLIATLQKHRIRRLTTLECMRLMGFGDEDEEAMRAIGMSDAAITHCAGDSIVVDVLMDIFNEMIAKKGIQQ